MEKKLLAFKDHVISLLNKIENDVGRTKNDWQERKGVFRDGGYVYKENLNVFANEIHSIQNITNLINTMDLSEYDTVADLKAHIISELEDLYDQAMLMRSGIAIIIHFIEELDE